MGKRNRVTTRDIAEYTGLSQSTVSMILSEKKNVSFLPETEEIVREAAKKLGYKKPEKKAAQMDTCLADTILLLAPLLTNSYYTAIIHAITDQAAAVGYRVLTAVTLRRPEKETEYLAYARSSRMAGIIILYPISRITEANALSKTLPVVLIGEKPDRVRFDSVELDSRKPGFLMGQHLLGLGHKHIAFVSAPIRKQDISRARRLDGLKMAWEEGGLDPAQIEVCTPSTSAYNSFTYSSAEYQTGYEMTLKALADQTGATAFAGQNDMTAYGIMAALREKGFRIPGDYSVGGFDNSPLSAMPQISLTSVEHATLEKGQDAVDLIYQKNHQAQGKGYGRITRMEYEPRLIVRQSTGKVNHYIDH
ncbi:MAG: LacI family DNA-binding transcriptional regulator [Eubacterium sp.]|nr:LacI family DNA-binding transcriptional regulator [Eubacterium sp.]